jgi:hypothetical protein
VSTTDEDGFPAEWQKARTERIERIRRAISQGRIPAIRDIDALLCDVNSELNSTRWETDQVCPLVAAAYTAVAQMARRLKVAEAKARRETRPKLILAQQPVNARAMVLRYALNGVCPDAGQCHGACTWCDQCGEVGAKNCHDPVCDLHRDRTPREQGCQCQWEAGDSLCSVHGKDAT